MNDEIMQLIRERDSLLKTARRTNFSIDWSLYTRAKCKTSNLIKHAKRCFFQETIDKNKGNPKGIWRALKTLSGIKKDTISIRQLITEHGAITDKQEIAEIMNDAFINIASQISPGSQRVADLGFDDVALLEFVKSKSGNQSFVIPPITEAQMLDLINKIPSSKAIGCDGLSAKVLKLAASVLVHPLCRLMNHSISTGCIPSTWKTAQVTPLFKNGSREDTSNYRPISVLPVLSKILERHVATSLCNHLHNYDLLYNLQSAFRPNHSTETALIKLTDELLFDMDNDRVTGLAFVDFRKAFDVINHELLLKKLSIYGANDLSLKWFGSYLTGRKQYVRINGCCSTSKELLQGVPQGSILGPILFLLFVNDMPLSIRDSTLDVYADDTTLSKTSSWENVSYLTQSLNQDLKRLDEWSERNKMFINSQKTKSMLVIGKRLRNRVASTSLGVNLNGNSIEQVNDFKLLGVTLDQDLSFNRQIEELCKKLSKRIGLLRHISPYLKCNQRNVYYSTIIKPVMLYGSTIWTSCSKENLLKVLRLQKRAARIILDAERTAPSVGLFNTLKWVPFYAESYINRCAVIYKRLNGNTPAYINDLLIRNSDTHNRTTRFCNLNLRCPRYKRSSEGGRTFAVRATKEWNKLSVDLKQSSSVNNFKLSLFRIILNNQNLSKLFM